MSEFIKSYQFLMKEMIDLHRVNKAQMYKKMGMGIGLHLDFNCISFNPGRLTGKTTFIMNNMKHGDLVIVNNTSILREFEYTIQQYHMMNGFGSNIHVLLADSLKYGIHPLTKLSPYNIWWDDYSYSKCFEHKEAILRPFLQNQYQTFILLG